MNKVLVVLIVLSVSSMICTVRNSFAQQSADPPLLMMRNPVPPGPPPPPGPDAGPPPPPGAGIGVWGILPTQTLMNNLKKAVRIAEKVGPKLTPGKVWTMRAPRGEMEIKAALLYQGVAVAVLHFDPLTGSVLPKGVRPHTRQSAVPISAIKTRLKAMAANLKILPAAEFREPEACWAFPIALGNTVVADLKVYCDGVHVVQDYPANQEMTLFGR